MRMSTRLILAGNLPALTVVVRLVAIPYRRRDAQTRSASALDSARDPNGLEKFRAPTLDFPIPESVPTRHFALRRAEPVARFFQEPAHRLGLKVRL